MIRHSLDRPFNCQVIHTDTNSLCYFIHRHPNNAWHNNAHSLTGMPYLTIIASNEMGELTDAQNLSFHLKILHYISSPATNLIIFV